MKRILFAVLALFAVSAHAQYKLFDVQQPLKMFDPDNESFVYMALPTNGEDCVQSFRNPTPYTFNQPVMGCLRLGIGLARSGDTLVMSPTSGQVTTALGLTPVSQAGARNAISLTTTGAGAATYNSGTGVLNVPTPTSFARVFANPARTLNSAFQISTTRDAHVVYTVDISVTSLLLAGASGRVHLEYADDAGFTTNVVAVSSSPNATGGVLNVTNLGAGNVVGIIPAGKYVRIRTQNVAATPTFTYQTGQEVLL